jgi:hypothetical protein
MGAGVFPALSTPVLLGSIDFQFTGIGTSNLSILEFPNSGLANFTSGMGIDLDGQLLDGSSNPVFTTEISNVPIPGSILLLGSGLVGLIGMARRKRS